MALVAELLTTAEAAVVSGVEVRDVNRLIDEHILPEELYVNEDSRRVWAGSYAFIRFYYGAADALTAPERKYAIDAVCREAKTRDAVRLIKTWRKTRPHWQVEHRFLTLDFDRFIADTPAERDKLTRACAAVVEYPAILGGTPVIKGTRVPVYDIAASAAAGISHERIKAAYPSLTDEMIELAILYAKATPPRGRPRHSRSFTPASSSRKVSRRHGGHEVLDRRMFEFGTRADGPSARPWREFACRSREKGAERKRSRSYYSCGTDQNKRG